MRIRAPPTSLSSHQNNARDRWHCIFDLDGRLGPWAYGDGWCRFLPPTAFINSVRTVPDRHNHEIQRGHRTPAVRLFGKLHTNTSALHSAEHIAEPVYCSAASEVGSM